MNEEHLAKLEKGVQAWNEWRKENPGVKPDLRGANLERVNLYHMNWLMTRADLETVDFHGTNLEGANLEGANLGGADFRGANLTSVNLRGGAYLRDADLTRADLLGGTDLTRADLCCANFTDARFARTVLVDLDLSETQGLHSVYHKGPCPISTSTLKKSRGNIPSKFLKGCGLSDWEIEATKLHNPTLTSEQIIDITYEISRLRAESPIQVNPIFISYSHTDTLFIKALEMRFDRRRIRYWRDVHDLTVGRLETQIDRAIRHNPIVLLVLSEASVESDTVEWEVSRARELEKQEKRDVLCPVALDDSWKTCSWPGPLRRQIDNYNILDFSEWQDDAAMERQFQKLIDGLEMFYPTAE